MSLTSHPQPFSTRPIGFTRLALLLLLALLAPLFPVMLPRPSLDPSASVEPGAFPPALTTDHGTIPASAGTLPYILPPNLMGKPELLTQRTAHSATFDLGDGRFSVLYDATPLHYQDQAGQWQHIAASFLPVEGGWTNQTNTVQTALAQHSSSAKVAAGTAGVGWQPRSLTLVLPNGDTRPFATPLPEADAAPGLRLAAAHTIRYPHGWSIPTIQDQWQVRPGSSEYTVRLAERPAGDRFEHLDLRVHLHLRPGTRVAVDGHPAALPLSTSSPLMFIGEDGSELVLQPPRAFEQATPAVDVAGSYALLSTSDPTVLELRVRIPGAWLRARGRQYPIIIDPVFQVRSPLSAYNAFYPNNTKAFQEVRSLAPLELGQFNDGVQRLAVEFVDRALPVGATLDRAYLIVSPGDVNFIDRDHLAAQVRAENLTSAIGPTGEPLSGAVVPFAADADPIMRYSRGDASATRPVIWDVSDLAGFWFNPPAFGTSPSRGVVLRTENEFCRLDPNGCGGFYINTPSSWTDAEVQTTEELSTPANPVVPPTGNSGIRLLVYYTGATITEGAVISNEARNPRGTEPPYYHADHEYRIAPLPADRWQAVAVRGIGPSFGGDPPAIDTTFTRTIRGSLPLELRDGATRRVPASTNGSLSTSGGVGYVMLNGRNAPGATPQLRIKAPAGEPFGYEVEMVGQNATISTVPIPGGQLGNTQVIRYFFDTEDPLALWNINVPPGSNSRVDIAVPGYNPQISPPPMSVYTQNVGAFQAHLYADNGSAYSSPADQPLELLSNNNTSVGQYRLAKTFAAETDTYGLALAYNGPRIDWGFLRGPSLTDVARVTFTIEVRVTACLPDAEGNPSYPTAAGTCQVVKCPSAFTPVQNTTLTGVRLWNDGGWTNGRSTVSGLTPFVGSQNPAQPGLAVVSGVLSIGGNSYGIESDGSGPPQVLLVNCEPPSEFGVSRHISPPFPVFEGEMVNGFNPIFGISFAYLRPADTFYNTVLTSAWSPTDRADLQNVDYRIDPLDRQARGDAVLRRVIGESQNNSEMGFEVAWTLDVNGWPSLTSEATYESGTPPRVASLFLGLGSNYLLNVQPVGGRETPRQFTELWAPEAQVTQPSELGGAFKPVVALLLPRGQAIPNADTAPCSGSDQVTLISCIDLLAPGSTFDNRNRTWVMPDFRTNVQPGTVALSRAGELQIFSTDHPAAHLQQALPEQYSFNGNNASVKITREPCKPGEPEVSVIRGGIDITVPNAGDTPADPNTPPQRFAATFKLCQSELRNVFFTFSSPIGIPLGNSGLFMTVIGGNIDINPGYTQVTLDMSVQAAQGGNGGILKGTGKVLIDTRGLFALQAQYTLLGFINGDGKLWLAWNPLDAGFEVQARIGDWLKGGLRAHIWRGQGWGNRYTWLPDNDELHAAGQWGGEFTVKEGAIFRWWFIDIPPDDVTIGVEIALGQFCTNASCTTYEWGAKGKIRIAGYNIGLYIGIGNDLTNPRIGFDSIDFILGNDDHVLIDQVNGAQTAPIALAATGPGVQARAPAQQVGDTITERFTVSAAAEGILFALGWQAGAPMLTLITPDGTAVTPDTAAANGAVFEQTGNSVLIGVDNPAAGEWQARISNLSGDQREQYRFAYFANKGAPGPATNGGRFLAPITEEEYITGTYTIRWEVPADTPDTTQISLFASPTFTTEASPSTYPILIAQYLPFTAGSYAWDTTRFPNGHYTIVGVVDDGITIPAATITSGVEAGCPVPNNELPRARAFDETRFPGTVVFTSTGTFVGNFTQPTEAPASVQVTGVNDGVLVQWQPVADPTITQYVVRWGFFFAGNFTSIGQQLVNANSARWCGLSACKMAPNI
ncbi:MAG: hypothetical protein HC914_18700, partial [Chloroflexaceae bacterium]|nr:hypothetical protein [Chloroflexaceae bacterium]